MKQEWFLQKATDKWLFVGVWGYPRKGVTTGADAWMESLLKPYTLLMSSNKKHSKENR